MPERVREYELLDPLGKGGMGQIYRARHILLDSFCAVKVIRRELLADAELRSRFLREALILRRLNASPFIVNCETVFEEKEQLYLVMELLEGETLGARMKRLLPSWRRDRRIFLQTVEAVAFAHQLGKGILHRDIKPSNIFILKDDAVKVLDFGLAKQLALETEDVTATGQMIGTPAYMPPEVLKGDVNIRDVGPEGDVYALGVLAYRLFTGKLPYDLREDLSSLDALTRLTKAHLLGAALTPLVRLCPDLPAGLSAAVMAALEPDAVRRPKDATELLKRLQEPLPTQAASASIQDDGETNDQSLVVNLPKFGEVGRRAQQPASEPLSSGKSPAPPATATKKPLGLIAAVVIAVLVIGGAYILKGGSGGDQKPAAPVTTAAPAPASPPVPAPAAPASPAPAASAQAKSLEDQAYQAMTRRDYNNAIKSARQALELSPQSTDAMKILGASYAAQKNKTEARRWFNRVLQENPSDQNAAEWLKKLK